MENILIIIDMQNDFIDGSLANKDAQAIVPKITRFIKDNTFDKIIFTRDTHTEDYLNTPEGTKLPIVHCIKGSDGWEIANDIVMAAERSHARVSYVNKPTFGFTGWKDVITSENVNITLVGTCTDICVVSNALILKALLPAANMTVIGSLCAGLTTEKHNAALETMRSCQITVED